MFQVHPGTKPTIMENVEGRIGTESTQALQNIGLILKECGASFSDLLKANVFLADIKIFNEMNEVYFEVMGNDPPARIKVDGAELALGTAGEIDAVAYKANLMSDRITNTQ